MTTPPQSNSLGPSRQSSRPLLMQRIQEAAESPGPYLIRTSPLNGIRNLGDLIESKKRKRSAELALEQAYRRAKSDGLFRNRQTDTPPLTPKTNATWQGDNELPGPQPYPGPEPHSCEQCDRQSRHNSEAHRHASDVPCPKMGVHLHVPPRRKVREGNAEPVEIKSIKRPTGHRSDRSNLNGMQRMGKLIDRIGNPPAGKDCNDVIRDIRDLLYRMEHYDGVDEQIIESSGILSPKRGLPRLFSGLLVSAVDVPRDLQTDARALHRRWLAGKFDWTLFRGIDITQNLKTKGLYRALEEKYKSNSNYEGEGHLYNGQWWPMRICLLRDGAHGATEAGIYGTTDKGALSVVVADRRYCDVDYGGTLFYCSTEGNKDGKKSDDGVIGGGIDFGDEPGTEKSAYRMSRGAKLMFHACKRGTQIRVIRSSKLLKSNPYRPKEGLRYDGLYSIEDVKTLDSAKQIFRFKMTRVSGQDPIRFEGESARPSLEELRRLEYWKEHQRNVKSLP